MRFIPPLRIINEAQFKRVGQGFAFFQRILEQIDEEMRGGEGCGNLILAMGRFIAQLYKTKRKKDHSGFHRIGKTHSLLVIDERHRHLRNENDSSAGTALESGCSKNHKSKAAALLALQLGHDATTPTSMNVRAFLVSAKALPAFVKFLCPRVMWMRDLRATLLHRRQNTNPPT